MDVLTTETVDLVPVLDRLNAATVALQRSKDHVPEEVVRLVEGLGTELHSEAPSALAADPYQVARLFGATLQAEKALRHTQPSDQRRHLRTPLEVVRAALVDIIEERPVAADQPATEVLHSLMEMLNVSQGDLADLLRISKRQLQRWLAPGARGPVGDDEAKVRIVAQLVNLLRHSFTAPGVMRWFGRANPLLGVAPVEWLDDSLHYPQLLSVARRSRFAP